MLLPLPPSALPACRHEAHVDFISKLCQNAVRNISGALSDEVNANSLGADQLDHLLNLCKQGFGRIVKKKMRLVKEKHPSWAFPCHRPPAGFQTVLKSIQSKKVEYMVGLFISFWQSSTCMVPFPLQSVHIQSPIDKAGSPKNISPPLLPGQPLRE